MNGVEQPFLLYPIGDLDEDPESLIEFAGIVPKSVKRNGPRWRRARVTIKFFKLDTREELLRERAGQLVALDNALAILESSPPPDREGLAKNDIIRLRSADSPHANCVRSACRMYEADPIAMRAVFAAARDYLDSE